MLAVGATQKSFRTLRIDTTTRTDHRNAKLPFEVAHLSGATILVFGASFGFVVVAKLGTSFGIRVAVCVGRTVVV